MALELGVQLYSLRNETEKDAEAAIKKTLEIGYKNLEFANGRADVDAGSGYGISARRLLEILKPYGAKISSAHMGPLTMETIPEIVKYHKAVGNRNIIEAIQFYTSYDHLMKRCEEYNQIGKYLIENDMNPLLYHNHYHEYQLLEGKEILYHIMENTDSKYLHFQIDTGWVKRAGKDPVTEMKKAGERLRIIHIKDFSKYPANLLIGKDELINWDNFGANNQPGDVMNKEDFVEIGVGVMEIQEIIDAANALDVKFAILEQDDSAGDIFESIAKSYENLKKYSGIYL